jgi:anhydro-N-acetylmuramic acid kinase
LGGQGAPLVPIGDRLLFSEYDYCLNLGGFSNISFEQDGNRIAFDISPVNTVLNCYANQLGFDYDDRGNLAKSGHLNADLFNALNQLDFYQKQFPKSLGFEYVKEIVLPLMESFPITTIDKMNTFVEHVALQVANALPIKDGRILITGGGAYNDFMIERMRHFLPNMTIKIPDSKVLEFKEALIFGLLGVLKMRNEINTLRSVTGARIDHSSGKIYD